ncbi:MAG: formylglycine-generating enzyme family protein [Polyangiaceae bacterium]|nr:formylglycine-generating enzyme family protein [Polyangiaceae bacterium]
MIAQRVLCVALVTMVLGTGIGCDDKPGATAGSTPGSTPAASIAPDSVPTVAADPTPVASSAPAAAQQLEPTPIVNPMIRIPGGEFTMGSNDGDRNEKPARRVRVQTFEMDAYEVTLRSYMVCINENRCSHPDYDKFCNWGKEARYDHPMNCLSWDQAKSYCEYVGKRLPTEAEWEYAARGTDGREYGWGEGEPPEGLCFNRGQRGTCRVDTVPVDSAFGLRGMAGNVWEWTSDGFNADYSKPRSKDQKVYRGASFLEKDRADLRAAVRNTRLLNVRMDYLGFRCARTPKGK